MKYFAFSAVLSSGAKVKALAHGAGTLFDLGGTQFRPSHVLPSYNSADPFARDLASIGSDFAQAMQTSQKPQAHRK